MNEGRYKMFSNRRRNLKRKRMIAAGLFITTVLLLFLGIYWFQKERLPIILIKVEDASIYPDEALPEFEVKASADNATKKIVLDAKEDYTVQDFLDMINAGEGYKIACKFDAADAKEGDYEIKMTYQCPGLVTGFLTTIIGILVFLSICKIEKNLRDNSKMVREE